MPRRTKRLPTTPRARTRSGDILTGHDGVQYLVHALMATARVSECHYFLSHVHPSVADKSLRTRAHVICLVILTNRNA